VNTDGIDRRALLTGGAACLALFAAGLRRARAQTNLRAPKFEALPNAIGLGDTIFDPTALDYVVDEYLMSGEAATLAQEARGNTSTDFSSPRVTGAASYTTRIVVYRPRRAARFSGNVVIEPYHPRNYPEVFSVVGRFLLRRGDVVIHVSQASHLKLLAGKYPERYGRLGTPDASTFWGWLAQLATLVKSRGAGTPVSGNVRRVYLTGYSATSQTTYDFYNFHHPITRLPNGGPVFDGYLPIGRIVLLAPERDAVLVSMGTQSDYLARFRDSTPVERASRARFDSDDPRSRRRRYEVPGLFHAPHQPPEEGMPLAPFDPPLVWNECSSKEFPADVEPAFDGPERPLMEACFHHAARWVDQGIAPPRAPLIEADDASTLLDGFGNARGGLRMPELSLPTAQYVRAIPKQIDNCGATGWKQTFPKAKLVQLYGSRARYLERYDAEVDKLLKGGFILPEGAADMKRNRRRTAPIF
jgi:hypothetical protein